MTTLAEPATAPDLATQLAQEIITQASECAAVYLEAVRCGRTDARKLLKLGQAAGKTPQQVQDDATAMIAIAAARAAIVDPEPLAHELTAASDSLRNFDDESKALELARQHTRADLSMKLHMMRQRVDAAHSARRRLQRFEAQHWAISGQPSPDERQRAAESAAQQQQAAAESRMRHNRARGAKIDGIADEIKRFRTNPSAIAPADQREHMAQLERQLAGARAVPVQ